MTISPPDVAKLVHERRQGRGPRARERFYMDCRRWGGVVNTPLKVSQDDTRAVTDWAIALRLAEAMVGEAASEVYATAQTRSRRIRKVFDYRLHAADREKHRERLERMHKALEAA